MMIGYFLKRFLVIIPMFFIMTGVYFCLQNYLPGGPVEEALAQITGLGGEGSARVMSLQDLAVLRADLERQYGLDQPIWIRYTMWLKGLMTLDFGDSLTTRGPALDQILDRLPISLAFGLPSFFLTYLVCIPLGILLATKDGSRFDVFSSFVLFLIYSIPALVFAVIFLLIFCTDRVLPMGALFPLGGWHSDDYASLDMMGKLWDVIYHMFLPVLASLMGNFTIMTLLQKNSMLDVIRSDYIRTARAKGLSSRKIFFKHALRNALLPMMVGFGALLGTFLGGSILIEPIFNLPGLGLLSLQSLAARDFNVLMAIVVFQSFAILLGQILSDVAYALVDPRIVYE